jgi:UDP-glucose 4-epimerase
MTFRWQEHPAMTKILLTGAAGFIPSSLAQKLLETESNVVVGVDSLLTGQLKNLPTSKRFQFLKLDVNNSADLSAVMVSHSFDYVFHYAAVVGVKRTLENPLLVLEDICGFQNLLRLAVCTGVKRVFFSSSSEVYGEPVELPQNELTTPLNSKLPYAIVKNVGEAFLKSYQLEHGLEYTIFRFFNTYGPRQSEDFVVSRFLRAALTGQPITIYGDGTQTRTFCFIDDNIQATHACLEHDLHINDIVNIGSELEITILELARTIVRLTKSSSEIVHLPALEEGDMSRRCPDATKMRQILGRPPITLDEGLQKLIASAEFRP